MHRICGDRGAAPVTRRSSGIIDRVASSQIRQLKLATRDARVQRRCTKISASAHGNCTKYISRDALLTSC
jgi:hypothetical protein